jgi:tetrapyrrole methylase family protein/MazG family protein
MPTSIADITIVGLGPGGKDARTGRAQQALDRAATLFVRSHGDGIDVSDLIARNGTIDLAAVRDAERSPSNPWEAAANTVVEAASEGPVALAIPGHPRFGEGLVETIIARAEERSFSVDVIDGISTIDLFATALNIDPLRDRVQLFDGRAVSRIEHDAPFAGGTFTASPTRPILLTHVYDEVILSGIHRSLRRILPPEHPVVRIEAAGSAHQTITTHTVADIPTLDGGLLVALYIPAQWPLDAARDPRTLQHIVARLRRPDGCPWDRKQDHRTLRDSIIDEAYEVLDAIDAGDSANFAEELGDLLLLIMMHAQIAEESGTFTLEDVYEGISRKIVRRHPHVFGDMSAEDAGDVIGLWNQVKAQEKAERPGKPEKADDGQPHSMPALTRAPRVLAKHPISDDMPQSTAEERSRALLIAVAAIVDAGDDPDAVLRDALINHVNNLVNNP